MPMHTGISCTKYAYQAFACKYWHAERSMLIYAGLLSIK